MNSRIRRPLLLRSDVGSEQQHNQDLREMYKGERVLEFITFYQNALHLTTLILPECIAFNHAECTAVPFTKTHRATTLGARDFSSAVSGFSQVFIVTRAKSFFLEKRGTREKPLVTSLSFCRGSRVEGSMSRVRVPCRGPRVTFFFPNFFWKR